jgi:predicted nuclease of predicted toxin-antitoxin system
VRWLADECVAASLVRDMRAAGHDVAYIAERAPGLTDIQVIALAASENRLLLTEDKDFGELFYRRREPAVGFILLRVDPPIPDVQWRRLQDAILRIGDRLYDRYTVIEGSRHRSRPLPARD